jgi:chromosome segregation ATPase
LAVPDGTTQGAISIWQGIWMAVGTGLGSAFAAWKAARGRTPPQPDPDDTLAPSRGQHNPEYGRRLDDLRREFDEHRAEVETHMREFAGFKADVQNLQRQRREDKEEILGAIKGLKDDLSGRLSSIEQELRRR